MSEASEDRIRQLTSRMLRKKLYVILSKGNVTPEQIAAHLPQHLEYMIGLEKQGLLFASGEVREWTVMEGSLGVKVNFSDQSLEIA